jgi:hypothetical protein
LIEELSAEDPKRFPVATICRLLKVSKSGFYEFLGRGPSKRACEDDRIAAVIEALRVEEGAFFNTYGSPRMHAELTIAYGFRIGRKRVERIMRDHRWVGSMKRKRKWGKANEATSEDRVNRNFTAKAPNQLWFTDITEHHTLGGKVYCAVVLDAFSRLAIGWSISSRMTADLVVDALQMARWRRLGVRGAIMHSDHGSQGGFNWSSQHLVIMEVFDGSSSAGSRSGGAPEVAVAWSSEVPTVGHGRVLGRDRQGTAAHRGGRGRRCVAAGWPAVVPQRWRHATV